MTRPLRIALVDDEPPALRRLRMALEPIADIDIVGEASNGLGALELIRSLPPDVVLLDIRMPGLSGLELIAALGRKNAPLVIFVTAFSRFATEAFEAAAVDYLLKPVAFDRLAQAIERARQAVAQKTAQGRIEELQALVTALQAENAGAREDSFLKELWVPDRGERVRLPVEVIDWVEAERDYILIHARGRSFLLRQSIRDLQAKLDPEAFVRIHRAALVRRAGIVRLAGRDGGPRYVVLQSGAEIPVARRQASGLRALLSGRGDDPAR